MSNLEKNELFSLLDNADFGKEIHYEEQSN